MTKKPQRRTCSSCKKKFSPPKRGRPSVYCSPSCRQRAYERRKLSKRTPLELLGSDLNTAMVRAAIRQEVIEVLKQAGLLEPSAQLPDKRAAKKNSKTKLKLITGSLDPDSRV